MRTRQACKHECADNRKRAEAVCAPKKYVGQNCSEKFETLVRVGVGDRFENKARHGIGRVDLANEASCAAVEHTQKKADKRDASEKRSRARATLGLREP